MIGRGWHKDVAVLLLALVIVSLIAFSVYAHWLEYSRPEATRLCFYTPIMLLPWIPGLCVLIVLAWNAR